MEAHGKHKLGGELHPSQLCAAKQDEASEMESNFSRATPIWKMSLCDGRIWAGHWAEGRDPQSGLKD